MIQDKIKSLGNGVYEFTYKSTQGKIKSFKYSPETICCVNYSDNHIIICDNEEKGIERKYINDFTDKTDYMLFALHLEMDKIKFNCKGNLIFTRPNEFKYGANRIINLDNIISLSKSRYTYAPGPTIYDEDYYIISFPSFQSEFCVTYDYKTLEKELKEYLNKQKI